MRLLLVFLLTCGIAIARESPQQQAQDAEYAYLLMQYPEHRHLAKALVEHLEKQKSPQAGQVRAQYQNTMPAHERQADAERNAPWNRQSPVQSRGGGFNVNLGGIIDAVTSDDGKYSKKDRGIYTQQARTTASSIIQQQQWNATQIKQSESINMYNHGNNYSPSQTLQQNNKNAGLDAVLFPNIIQDRSIAKEIAIELGKVRALGVTRKDFITRNNTLVKYNGKSVYIENPERNNHHIIDDGGISSFIELYGGNEVIEAVAEINRIQEAKAKYGSTPEEWKLELMAYVRKKTTVPHIVNGRHMPYYNVVLDPLSLGPNSEYNFAVSFNVEPRSMSDIEATYLAVVLTTREFLKELGAHNDQYIVRVRLFAPGTSIANTKEMQDKIFKYGKGHWKPGQYSPAFNRYWWEWTDGE